MTRIDEDALSLHLEVALSGAAPAMLDGLADPDRRRRHVAVAGLARHLMQRLRCFDIESADQAMRPDRQPSLFPPDLGPLGGARQSPLSSIARLPDRAKEAIIGSDSGDEK